MSYDTDLYERLARQAQIASDAKRGTVVGALEQAAIQAVAEHRVVGIGKGMEVCPCARVWTVAQATCQGFRCPKCRCDLFPLDSHPK